MNKKRVECPVCLGQGWYEVEGNNEGGYSEQVQCYYCKGRGVYVPEEGVEEVEESNG